MIMLSTKMNEVLNRQIQSEFQASYLYLAMSSHCEECNLPGFASWLRTQSEEERGHAMRLFDFLLNREGHVELHQINQPRSEFDSALEMFESVLQHEKDVTRKIDVAYRAALDEHDNATAVELQWFITEQVEEEKTAGDIVSQLRMVGDDKVALLMVDRDMSKDG